MSILSVEQLNKKYPDFHLKDVSFTLEPGFIMGFIGSNGAGKTTTLKSILNLVKADSGTVKIFEQEFIQNEIELKQKIGFMFGPADYYTKNKLSQITNVVKRLYDNWDNTIYNQYMKRFELNPNKKVSELSTGMRVKYSLTLALSHHAKLLIFDEPTSGLDPIARDDLLELFQELIEDGEKSILFSTHITSDLEKCADYITFIEKGQLIASQDKDELLESYRIVKGKPKQVKSLASKLISYKEHSFGFTGLIKTQDLIDADGLEIEPPKLDDIMIYYTKMNQRKGERI